MGRRIVRSFEPLEGRDLMSVTPILGLLANPPVSALTAGGSSGSSGGSTTSSGSTSSSTLAYDPVTGQVQAQNNGGSGITTDVSPSRIQETTRRNFVGKFSGTVQQAPPRLLDQSAQYYILAPGSTNQFLHGTLQIRYYTPNPTPIPIIDPATGVPALDANGNPLVEQAFATTGTMSMSDRSTQSGGVLLANLVGSTADEDKLGRPTHFTLNLNGGGGSGGIYASSIGTGTVDIAYHGNKATVTVRATIFVSGVGNPLDIFQSNLHL